MYQQRRTLERIVTTEIMKLERRQALTRVGAHPLSAPAHSPGRLRVRHEGGELGLRSA
jgi:hypothetical protein